MAQPAPHVDLASLHTLARLLKDADAPHRNLRYSHAKKMEALAAIGEERLVETLWATPSQSLAGAAARLDVAPCDGDGVTIVLNFPCLRYARCSWTSSVSGCSLRRFRTASSMKVRRRNNKNCDCHGLASRYLGGERDGGQRCDSWSLRAARHHVRSSSCTTGGVLCSFRPVANACLPFADHNARACSPSSPLSFSAIQMSVP